MNYISHLNAVFKRFSMDSRLNPSHISLYVALFQYWNIYRFPPVFYINREEIMRMAKIGSKATYHRILNSLSDYKYIHYLPSHNPYKGSRIKMLIFGTSSGTTGEQALVQVEGQVVGQALVSKTNNTKQEKNSNKQSLNGNKEHLPKNKNEVIEFFKNQNWPQLEAEKYYNHYSAIGWRINGKINIVDWKSSAKNWIIRAGEMKNGQTENALSQNRDNLKVSKDKDYGEPL